MTKLKLGIDDAGRGPVIGPMILAGCILKEEDESELKKLGVRDSKTLTQKRREFLAQKIQEVAVAYDIKKIYPNEIDFSLNSGTKLNELEANKMAEIVNVLSKKVEGKISLIIDCPSVSISKWKDYLLTKIDNLRNLEVSCEHKADQNHVSVSAASILAKCEREKEMDILRKKYGNEIGSGYTSDSNTQKFLKKNFEKFSEEGIFRKSWETYQREINNSNQTTLK